MGDTEADVEPRTLPTPWSIVRLVGAPPERVHASVEDPPEVIEAGVAVKELITGAVTAGGAVVTVTVVD